MAHESKRRQISLENNAIELANMPTQTYEIEGPAGILEAAFDHAPTDREIFDVIRAEGYRLAAQAQSRAQRQADNPLVRALQGDMRGLVPTGGDIGRGLSAAWDVVNPYTAVKGIVGAALSPIETYQGAKLDMQAQRDQASALWNQGHTVEAVGRYAAGLLPLVGPAAARTGTRFAEGDVAGGFGEAVGLLAGPRATSAALSGMKRLGQVARVVAPKTVARLGAQALARADEGFARQMTPTGSSKELQRLGQQARNVAQPVRRDTSSITTGGLHDEILERLDDASRNLNDSYVALGSTSGRVTPILQAMESRYKALTTKGVVSRADMPRAEALRSAIDELREVSRRSRGGVTTSDLAHLRNSWGTAAKQQFTPSLVTDSPKLRSAGAGWADAWDELQQGLTTRHPQLKAQNADFHVYKSASDVMKAFEQRERVRPSVGRAIMASGVGAMAGGWKAAILAPVAEVFATNTLTPAMKLAYARGMGRIGDMVTRAAPPEAIIKAHSALKASVRNMAGRAGAASALNEGLRVAPSGMEPVPSNEASAPLPTTQAREKVVMYDFDGNELYVPIDEVGLAYARGARMEPN